MHVLVFKTNITQSHEKERVGSWLTGIPHVTDWSVDVEDIDRVLRVVSHHPCHQEIINTVTGLGYECSELE